LLAYDPRPTTILATSDQLALGAIAAARERGLSVPDDVSVAGFDGVPLAATATPALTTVYQDHAEKGLLAGRLLAARLQGGGAGAGSPARAAGRAGLDRASQGGATNRMIWFASAG
jgi:DNA-binding LacI/PurR family transcriptional regulator